MYQLHVNHTGGLQANRAVPPTRRGRVGAATLLSLSIEPPMQTFRRALILTHRYLGIPLSLLFVLWFVSGISMIYINRDRLPFNKIKTLIDEADAAQAEIDAEPAPKKRRKLIKKHQDKWVAFRDAFAELSHHKCWYTESLSPGADWDVDHFRPKNRLQDEKTHGGYYWEALKWKNFRLSCHRSNRLRTNPHTNQVDGKSDRFPLLNPADRAWAPANQQADLVFGHLDQLLDIGDR